MKYKRFMPMNMDFICNFFVFFLQRHSLLLPEEQLILTENVIGAAVLRTDKEIYIREKIYDVFHNLEVGERVLLANVRGGQAWVILSKYYATELDELLEQNG